jgi:hypothetical protein
MKRFETPVPISVDIELAVANVSIRASDRLDTTVDVQPTHADRTSDVDMAANITVGFVDGRLRIARPRGNRGWRPGHFRDSVDVHVDLPAGSSVRGTAGVVVLECTGRVGEITFRAGVGTVRIDESGPITLTTGNGDVVVEHARGRVVAKSANGNVRVDHAEGGSIRAETARGKVEVGVGEGVAAWLDLTTAFGTVRNELDSAEPPTADQDTIEVRARTAFGDITIRRAAA